MARTWLQIRVDLLGGRDITCDPAPGRIFIVGPAHSFEAFAEAIDAGFARWDLSHLRVFELADGRQIGYPDETWGPEMAWLDHAKLKVVREVKAGDQFTYTFDLGDDWRHQCTVLPDKADPLEEYGIIPGSPVAILGVGLDSRPVRAREPRRRRAGVITGPPGGVGTPPHSRAA